MSNFSDQLSPKSAKSYADLCQQLQQDKENSVNNRQSNDISGSLNINQNETPSPIFRVIKSRNRSGSRKNKKHKHADDGGEKTFDYLNDTYLTRNLSTQLGTYTTSMNNEATYYQMINQNSYSHYQQVSPLIWVNQMPKIPQDIQMKMMSEGYQLSLQKAIGAVYKENNRRQKSIVFRQKRKQLSTEKSSNMIKQQQKNINRQIAAKRRVRDPNGKFQGGPRSRSRENIFTRQRHSTLQEDEEAALLDQEAIQTRYSNQPKDLLVQEKRVEIITNYRQSLQ
eukprot:403336191